MIDVCLTPDGLSDLAYRFRNFDICFQTRSNDTIDYVVQKAHHKLLFLKKT